MTKAEKIDKIKRLANVSGCIFLEKGIVIRGKICKIISNNSVMIDIEGDWCLVAKFEQMTEEEINMTYNAACDYARKILSMA